MPCPYFYPVGHLAWANAPRLPLGDAYSGFCHADPNAQADPGATTIRDLCNLGYARGRCSRFSAADGPDAIRFSVVRDRGEFITIYWVRERDHQPFDHGPLEYSVPAGTFTSPPAAGLIEQQARAYLGSYLRRKPGGTRRP